MARAGAEALAPAKRDRTQWLDMEKQDRYKLTDEELLREKKKLT
jgi:hypothetical protein